MADEPWELGARSLVGGSARIGFPGDALIPDAQEYAVPGTETFEASGKAAAGKRLFFSCFLGY